VRLCRFLPEVFDRPPAPLVAEHVVDLGFLDRILVGRVRLARAFIAAPF